MTVQSKGGDLFIVDNSDSGWTVSAISRSGRDRQELSTSPPAISRSARCSPWTASGRAREDPHPDGRRDDASHAGRRFSRPCEREPAKLSTRASRPRRKRTRSSTACRRSSRPCSRADRVPRLRQGQVPRQGLHHPRQARGRRLPGAGRFQQLHPPRPHREHRAQRPDPERPRGRAAPGMVRGALGRSEDVTDEVLETIERHTQPIHAVRCLRQGPSRVLPRPRDDRHRVGRDPLEDVPEARPLSEGGLLGADEDRPPARRRLPVRRRRPRQDLRRSDAHRAAHPARGQARRPVCAQGCEGRRSGSRICATSCRTSAAWAVAPTSATSRSSATRI